MSQNDTAFLQRLGTCIRERRSALNLTQAQLAEVCGLHRTFIGSVERGERNVAILSLRKIATALRTTTAELLTDLGAPTAKTEPPW
jgi:transcriptional regulator with XRE-family HTH domain